MSASPKQIRQLINSLTGPHNTISLNRSLIRFTGDHIAALVLSQLLYWSELDSNARDAAEGWFYKTDAEFAEALDISSYQLRRAIKRLSELGIEHSVRRHGGAPKSHYRVDFETFTTLFLKFLDIQETHKSEMRETNKSDLRVSHNSEMQETRKCLKGNINNNTDNNINNNNGAAGAAPAAADAAVSSGKKQKATKAKTPTPPRPKNTPTSAYLHSLHIWAAPQFADEPLELVRAYVESRPPGYPPEILVRDLRAGLHRPDPEAEAAASAQPAPAPEQCTRPEWMTPQVWAMLTDVQRLALKNTWIEQGRICSGYAEHDAMIVKRWGSMVPQWIAAAEAARSAA